MSVCKNCSERLGQDAKFCSQCGQKVVNYNKPLRPVLTEMLHEALDIDGRLFTTFKTLLFKPGQLSIAYRDGQRTRYTPPLRLYLVISILFFLLLPLVDPASDVVGAPDAMRTDIYPKLMFVLLPFFALLLHLIFRGTFYLSNLVFAIHIHCITYIVIALMLPLEANEQAHQILIALQVPFLVYLLGYLTLALKHYYAQSWPRTLVKLLVLFLVYASALGIAFDYLVYQLA